MKLRLHANSVRVRLNQSELARFAEAGHIEDAVDFGNGSILTYALELSREAASPRAVLRDSVIRIQLPWDAAHAWAIGHQTGIEGEQTLGAGGRLSILVEKDFQCLHGAPDPEAFPRQ